MAGPNADAEPCIFGRMFGAAASAPAAAAPAAAAPAAAPPAS